uniref:Uncharacterized protein n=1 Tax=Sphaerodactylus townsendi TaxID=933632 RepID=A0ACB8FA88_9SAUR
MLMDMKKTNAACAGVSCVPMNGTVTVATAHMRKMNLASAVTVRAQRTPIFAAVAALVLITHTASAVAVQLRIQSVSATKAGVARTSLILTGIDTEMTFHQDVTTQNHVFANVSYEVWEEKNCMLHPDSLISRYCLDDHELLCDYCKESWHTDHEVVGLPVACSKQSAALFSTIAKFKKVRYIIDNDLMEILVLKNNFKSYKEAKRREIRDGFFRLQNILRSREKEMMEAVENLEVQKQQRLVEYTDYTTKRIAQMDSLMQYSKEALKESSQIAFLQSSNSLMNEIEDILENVYQPSPRLKDDPIKHLKVNFEELAETFQIIFPSIKRKMAGDKSAKRPYPCSSDIMIPRSVSSAHVQKSLTPTRSQSLSTLTSQSEETSIDVERPKSSPPPNIKDRGLYAYWDASLDSAKNERNNQSRSSFFEPEPLEETTTVPGLVIIYQTLVYPTAAKAEDACMHAL